MNYKISYDKFSVIQGKEYIVYALMVSLGHVWYSICDESFLFYPLWNPCTIFDITDNRLSRYWVFSLDERDNKKMPFLSFPEWANDPYFFGELVEGNSDYLNAIIFREYKELMDLEFPDNSITEIAQIGDEEWLICPTCIDAWRSNNDRDALVKCPKCQAIFNNPRYKNERPTFQKK